MPKKESSIRPGRISITIPREINEKLEAMIGLAKRMYGKKVTKGSVIIEVLRRHYGLHK